MEAIEINHGEGVRAELRYTDEGGAIDLTGRTLSIVEAFPAALTQGEVALVDAAQGVAELRIPAAVAAAMGGGARSNWVRLGMSLPGGEVDTTPPIWISVV